MSFYNIVFSPTGGTKKVSDLFTKSFCSESTQIDLSDRNKDFSAFSFHEEDICNDTYGRRRMYQEEEFLLLPYHACSR